MASGGAAVAPRPPSVRCSRRICSCGQHTPHFAGRRKSSQRTVNNPHWAHESRGLGPEETLSIIRPRVFFGPNPRDTRVKNHGTKSQKLACYAHHVTVRVTFVRHWRFGKKLLLGNGYISIQLEIVEILLVGWLVASGYDYTRD
jgi:hypothetical protein